MLFLCSQIGALHSYLALLLCIDCLLLTATSSPVTSRVLSITSCGESPVGPVCVLFQKPFKAKPVPAHVHETRYQATVAGLEAAKLAAKVRAEMAREKAAAKLQETYKRRLVIKLLYIIL